MLSQSPSAPRFLSRRAAASSSASVVPEVLFLSFFFTGIVYGFLAIRSIRVDCWISKLFTRQTLELPTDGATNRESAKNCPIFGKAYMFKVEGSSEENEFHICVRICGVEGRGKSLSGQFFFVCKKDDREESSTKSLAGMTRPKDEMGSQIVISEFNIFPPILVYLSRKNNTQAQARRFPALTAPEPEFPVIFGSK